MGCIRTTMPNLPRLGPTEAPMERWERRAQKLDAKRRRMRVTGRGLVTTEPLAIQKRLKKLKEAAGTRRTRRKK